MSLVDVIPKNIKPFVYLGASATFVYLLDKYLVRRWLEKYYVNRLKNSGIDLINIAKAITFSVSSKACPSCVNEKGMLDIQNCENLDCNSGRINYLLGFVQNARRSVDVCMYAFTSPLCRNILQETHNRGVAVRLILNCEGAYSSNSVMKDFLKIGIPVRTNKPPYYMHHKMIIVDNEILITGSLNFTNNSILNNHETVIVLSRPAVVKEYVEVFQKLWEDFAQKR